MKKIFFLAVAATALIMASCTQEAKPQFDEETKDIDSLAYNFGRLQGDGFRQYILEMGQPIQVAGNVDSTCIDAFIKGVQAGAVDNLDKKDEAYAKGLLIGQLVHNMSDDLSKYVYADDSTKKIRTANVIAGFCESLKVDKSISAEDRQKAMEAINSAFEGKMKQIQDRNNEAKYGDQKKKNEEYLKANAKDPDVKTLPSGVQYKVLVEGKGALPTDSTTVNVKYEGKLIDGNVFDSNIENDQPFSVNMARPGVIPGWVEVLKLMPAGSKWEVTIPADQAYGSQEQGPIPPFSTLIFTIEVLK